MKKFLTALATVMAVVVMAFTLAGCTANVSGKTYVYSEVQMTIPDDASTIEQGLITTAKGVVETAYKNAKYTFGEDGKVSGYAVGTWKQEGKTVTVTVGSATATTFTVNGNKLELGGKEGKYEFKVVFTQQK